MIHISKAAAILRHEFLGMLPPVIYFAVAFNLVQLTTTIVLRESELDPLKHSTAIVLALIVGKVVLVVDKLAFVRRFDQWPLIYPIVFKAIIYSMAVFAFRLLEEWLVGLISTGSFADAGRHASEEIVWRYMAVAQIWIFVLFVVYFTFAELVGVLGLKGDKLAHAFFRRHPSESLS